LQHSAFTASKHACSSASDAHDGQTGGGGGVGHGRPLRAQTSRPEVGQAHGPRATPLGAAGATQGHQAYPYSWRLPVSGQPTETRQGRCARMDYADDLSKAPALAIKGMYRTLRGVFGDTTTPPAGSRKVATCHVSVLLVHT